MIPASHFFNSQRLRLHYVDWGGSGRPTVILLHGGRDHARSWDFVAERLRQDWHVVAPDLRGHGESQWSSDGQYPGAAYVYDLAQLIDLLGPDPVALVGHSRGGQIALRYAGLYPDRVRRLVAIEGLFQGHMMDPELAKMTIAQQWRTWIDHQRDLAARLPRRYRSLDEPLQRMMQENPQLTRELAMHLTAHGLARNEDGTYSWKFDNHLRGWTPPELSMPQIEALWSEITCPTLLVNGSDGVLGNAAETGQIRHFRSAEAATFEKAGHWVHHDQLDAFVERAQAFLR